MIRLYVDPETDSQVDKVWAAVQYGVALKVLVIENWNLRFVCDLVLVICNL